MADDTSGSDLSTEESKGRKKRSEEDQFARAIRLAKEADELRSSLNSGSLHDLKTRVAWILNLYPHTRNSDISLTLKFWEVFQPMLYNAQAMSPRDLFQLERITHIVRVRAKIQNEYKLFPADTAVRHRRRKIEQNVKDAVVEDKPARNIVFVFADETGKTQDYICVAAVWVLTGRSVFDLSRAIWAWKETSPWAKSEIHFSDFKKGQQAALDKYLDIIINNRELLSFKVIALEKATTRRPIDEVVHRLHELMLTRGAKHEVENNRISLPHEINLTVDAEQSLDKIACADIRSRVAIEFKAMYGDKLEVDEVTAVTSHRSDMVQLADVVAGAVNRRKNHKGERGHKDEMADLIISRLSIQLELDDIPGIDATTWLSV